MAAKDCLVVSSLSFWTNGVRVLQALAYETYYDQSSRVPSVNRGYACSGRSFDVLKKDVKTMRGVVFCFIMASAILNAVPRWNGVCFKPSHLPENFAVCSGIRHRGFARGVAGQRPKVGCSTLLSAWVKAAKPRHQGAGLSSGPASLKVSCMNLWLHPGLIESLANPLKQPF